jgi:hypothetical protein
VRPSPRPPSSPRPSPPALHRWPRPPSSALRSPLGAVVAAASEQPHPPEPRRSSVLARRRRWLGEAGSVSARSPTTLARSRDELAGAMAEQDSAFSDVAIEIDALDVFGNTAVAEFRVTSRRTEPFVVGGAAARWFRKSLPGGGAASHAPPSGRAPFQQVLSPAGSRSRFSSVADEAAVPGPSFERFARGSLEQDREERTYAGAVVPEQGVIDALLDQRGGDVRVPLAHARREVGSAPWGPWAFIGILLRRRRGRFERRSRFWPLFTGRHRDHVGPTEGWRRKASTASSTVA